MTESWKDKTVSLGNVKKEEFDSELAHVTVSENRIHVEFKDVEDWKRIQREVGEETVLKEVPWEDVESLEINVEHLYYPHIDVETPDGVKRLYFLEDETDILQQCRNAVKRFWNVYRESGGRPRNSYSYEGGDDEGGGQSEETEATGTESSDSREEGADDSEDDGVEDVVEGFMEG